MNTEIVPYTLLPGHMISKHGEGVIRCVLGSSVAVCITARLGNFACMNHFVSPATKNKKEATAMFGNVATLWLIKMAMEEGFTPSELQAQIFGGAYPETGTGSDIGRENCAVAEDVLRKKKIPLVSSDVAGHLGRKIVLDVGTGHAVVMKVKNIRHSDWHGAVW
ncbi:chemotaxis protein CheD [Chitinivibrio alkaliphilus]|uniref:Probable chemoreceptor glutamine deamidase CheD n=1 Tax=Chitinivibrio alkaliphilus ACht1 TaxID=1313304 RepID=U7D666_9BACT|nr:chemotaxis protein CheD [Chitinivibrio alkaliphilus]ERP32009.1 chemotaxis protein CheD [Chitinivibrio alkaliphilus ACht1]